MRREREVTNSSVVSGQKLWVSIKRRVKERKEERDVKFLLPLFLVLNVFVQEFL